MKKQCVTLFTVLSSLLASPLSADTGSYIDTARVLDVEPIYETIRVTIPETRCWSQPLSHSHHPGGSRQDSYTGAIAGGIIGGVVGNQFGRGSGKKVMTVAGTLLGLSIGHDLSRGSLDTGSARHHREGDREVCETVNRYESREEIVGYHVKYRYKGNRFWTRTSRHPGKHLRIQVRVTPLPNEI